MEPKEDANPKKRGLGRGLDALFEDEETRFALGRTGGGGADEDEAGSGAEGGGPKRTPLMLGIDQIEPWRGQPRGIFNEDSLEELAESIRAYGLLQPLLVRPRAGREGAYQIVAGERRWLAAQKAQLHEVPVVIRELSDLEALEIGLIENLQREDLRPIEEADAYKKLMEQHGHTQEQLAAALGKSRSHIANMLRLLSLPSMVQAYLDAGEISAGHARALIGSKNAETLLKQVVNKGLSVRQTEALAAEDKHWPLASDHRPREGKDPDTLSLEKDMTDALGMRVTIESRAGTSGKVTIAFKSLDQLDEVIKRLLAR